MNSSKSAKNNIYKFIQLGGYFTIILSIVFVLLAYGIKLSFYSVSIDTEFLITNPEECLNTWLGLGRFSLIFVKKIFNLIPYNQYVSSFLMIVFNILNVLMLGYTLWLFTPSKTSQKAKTAIIAATCFITFPIFAEQYGFSLQVVGISLGIFTTELAVFLLYKAMLTKKKMCLIISIILAVFSFGMYQSNVAVYISLVSIIYMLLLVNSKNKKGKNYFLLAFKIVSIFIISFLIYMIINKLVGYVLLGLSFSDAGSSMYLSSQIFWGKETFSVCLDNIIESCKALVLETQKYPGWLYFICTIFTLIFMSYNLHKIESIDKKTYFIISVIIFLISPFLLTFLMANVQSARTHFSLALVIASGFYLFSTLLENKMAHKVYISILIIVVFYQSMMVSNYFYADYLKYQRECIFVQRIVYDIDQMEIENIKDTPVVFIGQKSFELPEGFEKYQWETIGRSFFEWDTWTKMKNNARIHGFLKTLGYDYLSPNEEQVKHAEELSLEMNVFPDKNSIEYKDGLIIVKLSN